LAFPTSFAGKSTIQNINLFDQEVNSVTYNALLCQIDTILAADPSKALILSTRLLEIGQELSENIWFIAKAKERIGVSYYYLDNIIESNKFYFEALLLFDSLGDKRNEALTLNNIAWNFRVQKKNDLAIKYFESSLELCEHLQDWERVQGVLNNLGTAYRREEGMKQEAMRAFKNSLQINKKLGKKTWMAFNFNNIGLIHLDLQQYDSAISNFNQARQINESIQKHEEYCRNLLNIAITFIEIDQIDSALLYFKLARTILDKYDFPKTEYVYNDYQYELHLKKENYKSALDLLLKKIEYERIQLEKESKDRIDAMRVQYEEAKKVQELELIQHRSKMRENLVAIMLLASIVILMTIIYYKKSVWVARNKKLNEELHISITELKRLNDDNERIKNNLNKLVREETKNVIKKNEKLQKYAFINSHKIRAPLARILGLIHVINLEGNDIQNNPAFQLLNEASEELDQEIKAINQILLEEEPTNQQENK